MTDEEKDTSKPEETAPPKEDASPPQETTPPPSDESPPVEGEETLAEEEAQSQEDSVEPPTEKDGTPPAEAQADASAVADATAETAEGSDDQLPPSTETALVSETEPASEKPPVSGTTPTDETVATAETSSLDETAATSEATADVGEAADESLSDITLTDTGGRLTGWLRGLSAHLRWPLRTKKAPATATPKAKPRFWRLRPWQWALIAGGTVVLLFAIFVAVDAGLYYDKIHHGISVVEQDLSRMTEDAATEKLASLVEEAQDKPITLGSDSYSRKVIPTDLDTQIDVGAVIDSAMAKTRNGNVFVDLGRKIALYFRGADLPLEGTIDSGKMDALLAEISEALDVPAVSATLKVVDGEIEVIEGTKGKVVDQEALRTSLTELLFALHDTRLPIPLVVESPDLVATDVEPALAQAKVMVSDDLVLTYEGEAIATITPTQLLEYISVAKETDGETTRAVPILSAKRMTELLDTIEPQVGTPPVDATFEMDLEAEEPYPLILVEGVDGEGLDREATVTALTQAALETTDRTAEVVLKIIGPDRTAEDVEAMGITDLLGDYRTSPYTGSKNRQHNVRLGTSLCSGVFLAPGELFDTDQRLGLRTSSNGWRSAPGIVGPGELEDVLGGGICQISTTLFNAALLAGLEIVERHNHSIYISHYNDPDTRQGGRDATVTSGGKNMRFRNDTDNYVFIYGWSTGINTRFWIWGVDDGREVQPIKWSGFSIGGLYDTQTIIDKSLPVGATEEDFEGQRARSCSITRTIVYADGKEESETWKSRWRELPKVIRTNPKPVTTTTKAPAAPTTTVP